MKGLDLQIEKRVLSTGITYVDAVVEFAKEHEIDIEDVVKELHSSVVEKIQVEFINRNMVKGEKLETSIEEFME